MMMIDRRTFSTALLVGAAASPISARGAQAAGQYACDLFIGGTLQIDAQGNSSSATKGRITGFGGAPNMGADARRRKLVRTHQPNCAPSSVERLDAFDLAASAGFARPPIMIDCDDATHVITERGEANLLRCWSPQEREAALRAVAGDTEWGKRRSPAMSESLRRRGIVMLPADLGIDVRTATRNLLAAHTINDLVTASGGLYAPPARFLPHAATSVAATQA